MNDLVMAWARHVETGMLLYILELSAAQRGKACLCVCISCNEPLLAVNAAKATYRRRPHFRHRTGVQADSCMVLASRELLRASLHAGETIVLPRFARSANFIGLSGAEYTAWIDVPAETVRIGRVDFRDGLLATLVLDDGRELEVQVVGSADFPPADAQSVTPRIVISLEDDPSIVGMTAADIRRRLVPALAGALWCNHWSDDAIAGRALAQAENAASDALDWTTEDADLPAGSRRESLLHREVKAILEQAHCLCVPAWRRDQPGEVPLQLRGAVLEKRLGRIIPDVVAQLADGSEVLIEVTVTNTITDERCDRIKAVGLPTLEIDLSLMGGRVTRQQLADIVTDQIAGKRWIYHPHAALPAPDTAPIRPTLSDAQFAAENFLKAVELLVILNKGLIDTQPARMRIKDAQDLLAYAAEQLASKGYPEAMDAELIGRNGSHSFLERILWIKLDRGVDHQFDNDWQLINAIILHTPHKWHVVYLMAIHAFNPRISGEQQKRVHSWRKAVVDSVKAGEATYLRATKYDSLLALLFPEMADQLASSFALPSPLPTQRPAGSNWDAVDVGPEYYNGAKEQRWMWQPRVRSVSSDTMRRLGYAEMSREEKIISGHVDSFRGVDPWAFALALLRRNGVSKEITLRFLHQQGYTQPF